MNHTLRLRLALAAACFSSGLALAQTPPAQPGTTQTPSQQTQAPGTTSPSTPGTPGTDNSQSPAQTTPGGTGSGMGTNQGNTGSGGMNQERAARADRG